VPLVQAAVHRFEGTLDVFRQGTGGCLHCLWLGRDRAALDTAGGCAGGPVFGPAVGLLGVMQAAEAIKVLLGLGGEAAHQTRLVNLLDGSQLSVGRRARPDCPVCAQLERLRQLPAPIVADRSLFVDAAGIRALGASTQCVYLTEPGELAPAGAVGVSASDLVGLRELALKGALVLSCRYGVRSAALARMLRTEGLAAIYAHSA
jgi:sulfur-carrier protein adenylyltransferase/sulfurtransferase